MSLKKYAIPLVTLLALLTFVFVFTKVFVYLIISMVLALIGGPIVQLITKVKFGKLKITEGIAAALTLIFFFAIIYLIGITFLPPLVAQISFLSKLNFYDVMHDVLAYYPSVQDLLAKFGDEKQLVSGISKQLSEFMNFNNISYVFNNTLSYTASLLGGMFSVLFITFFFLKDERMVVKSLLLITPSNMEGEVIDIFRTSKKMLSKYFTGLFLDVVIVSVIVTALMWLFGIKNALVIGCLAGIMNVIPYIGPFVTLLFAVFLGVSGCIEYHQYELISSTITKIIFILIGTNIVDAFFIQPTIFSNTVKAHPLEIFIVILMAAALGGIVGMVVAIPSYTLLRIIAKEFLDHFKFFKKLTQNIPE